MCFSSKLPESKHIFDVTPELFHFWWYASSFSGLFPKCLISRCLRPSVDGIGLHSPHFLHVCHSVTICLRVAPALESRCCIFPGLNRGIGLFNCVQQGGIAWPAQSTSVNFIRSWTQVFRAHADVGVRCEETNTVLWYVERAARISEVKGQPALRLYTAAEFISP